MKNGETKNPKEFGIGESVRTDGAASERLEVGLNFLLLITNA